jgi:hypothetical protein
VATTDFLCMFWFPLSSFWVNIEPPKSKLHSLDFLPYGSPNITFEETRMDPTTVRVIAAVIMVVLVFVIIARRKRMASRRHHHA